MSVFLGQQQQQTQSPPEWKTSIYSSLVHRNHTENSHFYSIVNEYRLLLQENATQKSSLLKLKSENRTLLNKNVQLSDQIMLNNNNNQNNNNHNNSSSLSDNLIFHQKVKQLEEKIVQLQEELTSSLKGKAESIQQQLNLNNEIKELNKQLSMRKDESEDVKKQLTESQKKMVELERSIESKNGAIDVLKGDIVALREDLSARDDQMNKLKEENRQMIDRAINEKQKQVDAMNQVNELHRTVMIQKQQLALLQAKYQTQNSSGGHDNIASSSSGSNNNSNNMMTMDESEETLLFANHLMNQSSGSNSSGGGGRGSMGGRSHSNASSDNVSLTPPKQVLYRKMTDSQINAVVFSSDSMMIATAHNDKTVKLWNSRTGTITTTLHGSADAVVAVSMCPNQRLVAGSSTDNICRIWSMATARVQYSLTGHTKKIYATDFTNDGKRLITGSHDRTIKIWELQYGNCEKTLLTCKSSVNDLECNPGTPIFISGHFDACARLWDLRSPYTLVHEYNTIHKQQITSVNFSRDGNTLLTNARDNLLQVIDVRTHKILHTLSHDDYKNNVNQNKAVMSPCGSYAIAGTSSTKNVCYVWDISPRSLAMRIAASSSSSFGKSTPTVVPKAVALDGGHKQAITGCAWSPDGAQIASVSIDKQLVVYQ